MAEPDGSVSVYLFDIDDNLFVLPTSIYLWNAETQEELAVGSGEFAQLQSQLGRAGKWQPWAVREETFRDFRDRPAVPVEQQTFVRDLRTALDGTQRWQGPSWPLLVHAATEQRSVALVTARGHEPSTIEAGFQLLVTEGLLPRFPNVLGIYTVTNPGVRSGLGASDAAMTVPSVKKLAIKDAVERALERHGKEPPHRFGMSDDDPENVVFAISAMRDCKIKYPGKRFFVINTNQDEFVKLEVLLMDHPATATPDGPRVLRDGLGPTGIPLKGGPASSEMIVGGNASVYVSNMDRAVGFYTSALGLRLKTRVGQDWAELDAGSGFVIGLHPARPPATPAPGSVGATTIELRVTGALEDVVAALTERGVQFRGAIANYENVRLATLADQDQNVLVLAQVLH